MSTCLARDIDTQAEAAKSVAAGLLGGAVSSIEPIGGGRNSRVYRVIGADGRSYALKAYFRHQTENRDRMKVEFESLQFLWQNKVRNVPQPLAADWQKGYALYTYVEGRKSSPEETSADDIEAAVAFLGRLKGLARQPASGGLPCASEACFCGNELLSNLRFRLERLRQPLSDEATDPALGEFVRREFLPAFDRIVAWSGSHLPFDRVLPQSQQTLSPSDFGFHNALRRKTGEWVFLDFEHFGWDDPAKMVSDFLLHPAMQLTAALKRQFVGSVLLCFAEDRDLSERLQYLYPMFGLKWCLILLNEFLPGDLLRREFAAGIGEKMGTGTSPDALLPLSAHVGSEPVFIFSRGDRRAVQAEQLAKARRMLQQVYSEYEHFAYLD